MRKYEKGQILLIVVLVMTIALTVGLSIATRTITNIRTSTEQDNSQRAFSAAEAGLEKALQEVTGSTGDFTNNASYETTVTAVSGTNFLFNNGAPIIKDTSVDLWLSTYPDYSDPWEGGTVTIYWGNVPNCNNPNTTAALDIILVTGTKNDPVLSQYPIDPCEARADVTSFDDVVSGGTTIEGKTFAFGKEISITDGLLMRIVPLYTSTIIGVRACTASGNNCTVLPSQGKLITSVGTSDTTQRKIVGVQENPRLPMEIFPYIIFSP